MREERQRCARLADRTGTVLGAEEQAASKCESQGKEQRATAWGWAVLPEGRKEDRALGPASVCSHDPAGLEARGR